LYQFKRLRLVPPEPIRELPGRHEFLHLLKFKVFIMAVPTHSWTPDFHPGRALRAPAPSEIHATLCMLCKSCAFLYIL
jgi:hypothetical protein